LSVPCSCVTSPACTSVYIRPFLSEVGVRSNRVEIRAFTSYRKPAWRCHRDLTLGSMIMSCFLTTAAASTMSPTTTGARGTTTISNRHGVSHSSCTSRKTALVAGALVLATCGTTSCSAFAPGPRGMTVLRPSGGGRGGRATSPVGRRSATPGAKTSLWAGERRGGGGLTGSVAPELNSTRRRRQWRDGGGGARGGSSMVRMMGSSLETG
ncbi:unnamed protein product, partial [Ectocarpus sp. 12 AP-2014]